MRAVIIDDELHVHSTMGALLQHVDKDVQVVANAQSVAQGIQVIKETRPDLVFLDIKMNDGSGFDLIKALTAPYPHIIFVTAHDEFALDAFRFSAIDYLVKPVDMQELKNAIDKARERIEMDTFKVQMEILGSSFDSQTISERIVLRDSDSVHVIMVNDVLWCSAEGSYTYFHLVNDKRIVVSRNLKEYETLLKAHNFYRIHRSYLINCNHVVRYDKFESNLVFTNDKAIPISIKKDQLTRILSRI
ncbi:MAG: LytTR family DNA-binding domain-containing protein [Roseivirga sp.]